MINWLTAHGYHSGNSEIALKECLTSRYKREDFILTDKLTEPYFRKEEGKIKHIGISFHDTADILDMILEKHPEIEIVQIQFNYADYDNAGVQSKKIYEVCRKYNKRALIMEPAKGGGLVRLPDVSLDGFAKWNPNFDSQK